MKARNGKIEFFRFCFCITVIFYHLNQSYFDLKYEFGEYFSFFRYGKIGVEFFFIVTGFLFARSCYKNKDVNVPLGKDTIQFVFHKWLAIFPYHAIAFFVTFIAIVFIRDYSFFESVARLVKSLPNFFLIQKTGIYSEDIIGVEWYISVMLLSLFILYPICKKYYEVFTRIVSPVIGIFLIGYLCEKYGYVSGVSAWDGIISKVQLRGLAEICIGVFTFEVSRFIHKYSFSKILRFIFSIIEYGCYVAVLLFSCSQVSIKYEAYALYALAAAVCLSFSGLTFGSSLFQNKVFLFLGKLSLPIYLSQTAVRLLVQYFFKGRLSILIQVEMIMAGIFLLSLFIYVTGNKVKKIIISFLKNCKVNG